MVINLADCKLICMRKMNFFVFGDNWRFISKIQITESRLSLRLYAIGRAKNKSKKKIPKKKGVHVTEGGEETDEGDLESWEVDYMSDASSMSDKDYKVRILWSFHQQLYLEAVWSCCASVHFALYTCTVCVWNLLHKKCHATHWLSRKCLSQCVCRCTCAIKCSL